MCEEEMKIDRGAVAPARARTGALAPSRCGSTQKSLNMASNIKVAVRVRPLNDRERGDNSRVVVDVVDEKMLVFDPTVKITPFFYQGVQQPNRNFLKRVNKELKFVFDNVCGQDASNKDVFEMTTKDMLASLMEGYNCSVFVYGATGAGKTFTMIGNNEYPGITYLTMEHLFYTINSFEHEREFDIGVSYIEVYNENVYDLLKPSNKPLQLREDNHYGVIVAGLTLHSIKTAQELLHMLESGNKNRTQHPTDANAESSRSHAVFQVFIKMRYKTSSEERLVKLSMIDLAGSERASATGCVGDRFKEGANINKSLLSLGNCINKLADGSSYIPYRDSKLTRLLKDSLGGNCKTVMIANVSPSSISYEDTYNTLKYAARANKIQLSIKKNIVDGDVRVSQYVKIVEELKNKIKELEAKLSLSSVKEPDTARDKSVSEWRDRVVSAEAAHGGVERTLLALMVRQRVLALRRRLRARASTRLADLLDDMEQMSAENVPREERAAKQYMKQSVALDTKVMAAWREWDDSRNKLNHVCATALAERPELGDLVAYVRQRGELRQAKASDDLRYAICVILNEEIDNFSGYVGDMTSMVNKLYLTLRGFERMPPALTAKYLDIMKRAKSTKGITWSDEEVQMDDQYKFIVNLNVERPSTSVERAVPDDADSSVDILTDEDVENKRPGMIAAKRKGTPIKLANDETIVINDSLESLDTTRNMNSAKRVKRGLESVSNLENCGVLDPKDLNSTFVLAGKTDAPKKNVRAEREEPKRGLADRTNTVAHGTVTFNRDRAKCLKPLVGKVLPLRRAGAAGSAAPGFGSSLARDGTPLQRNIQESARLKAVLSQKSVGCKAVRARERVQNHPYSRPPPPRR